MRRTGDSQAPIKSLKGFKRVNIAAGGKKEVKITLGPDAFSFYDGTADDLVVKSGRYEILYGSSSASKDLQKIEISVK